MNRESTPRIPSDIDTDRPYLMPRNSGAVDVAHIKLDQHGEPVFDEQGWVTLVSQNADAEKQAHPDALSDEVQGHFADELGESRPGITPEQRERHTYVESHMADAALDAAGIELPEEPETEEENEVNTESPLDELLAESSWKEIDGLTEGLKNRTHAIISQLDEFDGLLSRLNYEGGRSESSAVQLSQSLETLRQVILTSHLDVDLADRTRSLRGRAEEAIESIRRGESSDEDERLKARKTQDNVDEISSTARVISSQFDDLRSMVGQYGKFESNVEELIRTTRGYEYVITMLKSEIKNATDDMHNVRGRLNRLEANLEDVDRLRSL